MLRTTAILTGLTLLVPAGALTQVPTASNPVVIAQSAAPPQVARDATVIDLEGNILHQGTNGWTCVPVPDAPMCLDSQWMSWLDAYLNQRDEVAVTAVGIAYMLQGDTGASNVDPSAEGPTATNQWVVTGPHMMLVAPDPALLAHIPSDPATGGPYVMWRGHPLEHVMIPLDETGAQLHRH
jgi:hypothetical protein